MLQQLPASYTPYTHVRKTIAERFFQYVHKTETCWLWTGPTVKGYGRLKISGEESRDIKAHRLSWELHRGKIPAGMLVCHTCDVPLCVRPEHLFLGTPADNFHDCLCKSRFHPASGEEHWNRKLNDEKVRQIKAIGKSRTLEQIAKQFGICKATASLVLTGKRWKHVQ